MSRVRFRCSRLWRHATSVVPDSAALFECELPVAAVIPVCGVTRAVGGVTVLYRSALVAEMVLEIACTALFFTTCATAETVTTPVPHAMGTYCPGY